MQGLYTTYETKKLNHYCYSLPDRTTDNDDQRDEIDEATNTPQLQKKKR